MLYSKYLAEKDIKEFEYTTIPHEIRVAVTRMLYDILSEHDGFLYSSNRVINYASSLRGGHILALDISDDTEFLPDITVVHQNELMLCLRRLDTLNFLEMLCWLVENNYLEEKKLNALLDRGQQPFNIENRMEMCVISKMPIEDDNSLDKLAHPNIKTLVKRMDTALSEDDYSNVLHSSASIFETLAKDILSSSVTVQNQPLGSFFEKYKNESALPETLINKILEVYKHRNTSPLAGHGSTASPAITKEEAITLSELTKAFVKIEYKLSLV